MIDREELAEQLYTAYCIAVGGIAFNGDPLPSWDKFSADSTKVKQSQAWLRTADKAIDIFEEDLPDE